KLEKVTEQGELIVSGADLLDGTPIYDIKPYLPYADSIPDALGGFTDENKRHRLKITDGAEILNSLPRDKIQAVIDCICEDPRPSYQDDKDRVYSMRFSDYDIHFTVDGENVTVTGVEIK
ncbi:MAG: SAM-dependent methyltransferase, partial [Clostridia bacterium]|nr:SAM-dependent methyltransferase [Clostridia bacterium]